MVSITTPSLTNPLAMIRADVTVIAGSALPIGTVVWSSPGDGSGVSSVLPAVPTGVADVFALQGDGAVQAVASDGTVAWAASVGGNLVADFQGGLVVFNGTSLYKIDGVTGQPYPAYSSTSGNALSTPVVHTDGTIFTVDGDAVVGIDPLSGEAKFSVHLDDSSSSSTNLPQEFCFSSPMLQSDGSDTTTTSSFPLVGNLIIAGDGYAYLPYVYQVSTSVAQTVPGSEQLCTNIGTSSTEEHLRLLRVGAQGDSYVIALGDWTSNQSFGPEQLSSQSAPVPVVAAAARTLACTRAWRVVAWAVLLQFTALPVSRDVLLSADEQVLAASKVYSFLRAYSLERRSQAFPELDIWYQNYIHEIVGNQSRRQFDLATIEFVAHLHSGHTFFWDAWLDKDNEPWDFNAIPLDGKWVVQSSSRDDLKPGGGAMAKKKGKLPTFVSRPFTINGLRMMLWKMLGAFAELEF